MEAGDQRRLRVGPGGALRREFGKEGGLLVLRLFLGLFEQLLMLRQLRGQPVVLLSQLAAQLAEQKELLKKTQQEAEEAEAALLAEFTSERSSWTNTEATLVSSFHGSKISSTVSFPLFSFSKMSTAS